MCLDINNLQQENVEKTVRFTVELESESNVAEARTGQIIASAHQGEVDLGESKCVCM